MSKRTGVQNTFTCFKIKWEENNPMSFLAFSDFGHFLLRYCDNQSTFGGLEGQRSISSFIDDGEK